MDGAHGWIKWSIAQTASGYVGEYHPTRGRRRAVAPIGAVRAGVQRAHGDATQGARAARRQRRRWHLVGEGRQALEARHFPFVHLDWALLVFLVFFFTTGHYRSTQDLVRSYEGLRVFTGFYQILPDFSGFFRVMINKKIHPVLVLGFTGLI